MPNTKIQKTALSQNTAVQDISIKRFLWLKTNFAYCLILSTIVWGVGLSYYIENFIGWSSVLALEPKDLSMLILAVTLPLFFLWFILAYIERSSSLDANAQLCQLYIDNLMYPNDETSGAAKAISLAIQKQLEALQKENQAILNQSNLIKKDLEGRITELSDILKLLDDYSAKTLTQLNDGVKDLANRCTYVTEKTSASTDKLRECTMDMTQSSDKFLSKLTPILDEMAAMSSNIKNNIVDNKNYLATAREQLGTCADISKQYVRDMLSKTEENTRKIERSFYKAAEEYDVLYKRIDTSISSIEGRVEEQKQLIQTQTQVINHNSDLINNKLSKYGKTVSGEIDKLVKNSMELEQITKKQISALKAVNHETGSAIRNIGDIFDEKRIDVERKCEYAVNSMQNVIIAINKETEKLNTFTNLTQAKNHDLQHISETIVDKIGDISNQLALKTDTLKDKAVEVIDKFTEATEIINRNTDKINKTSNLLLNNTQTGVKLLEEQNFYINNALSNMDVVQKKLDTLREGVAQTSGEITQTLNTSEKHLDKFSNLTKNQDRIEPLEPEFDREKIVTLAKGINQVLRNSGINPEKCYEKADLFSAWDNYLKGNQTAFTEMLNKTLSAKQINSVRKAFDDNAEFHNQVIRYLFLMDIIIKEMVNPDGTNRSELINLSVNLSLDKLYFVLVKALNSVD